MASSNASFSVSSLEKKPIFIKREIEKIAFRPKLTYSQQGDREKSDYTSIDVRSVDYKLSYLNIPLNFKFFNKPYLLVGPQIGFLLSTEKQSQDFGDVKSGFDYGANFGVGYDFKEIFVEFNIYQGMSTLIETERRRSSRAFRGMRF